MTRLSESHLSMAAPGSVKLSAPWICSGQCTAATVVCSSPCLLGAILVEIDDTGQDSVITVYDSADSTTTDDEILGIFNANLVAKTNSQLFTFPSPGVECKEGIYFTVVGDVKVYVYYR